MLDIMLRIAYLSAIGLSLYTSGWLLMKADKTRTTGALAACQLLIIIWCMPQLFSALPMTKGMKYLAYGISYIGISFIGPAWLEFAFLYSRRKLGHGAELFLFGISAVNYSVLLTNEYHHLFYTSFEVAQVVYGPVFYIHMAYTYICVLAGMAVVLAAFKKNRVALAHNTMAFDKIFDSIAEGVVVYNRRDKITYCNGAAVHWLGLQTGDDMEPLRRILGEKGAKADCADSQTPVFTLEDNGERRRLEVRQYIHRDKKGDMVAGTIMLTDVGRYYQLLEQGRELAVTNQSLAIEKERNRIAQEVHDTAGHTLTMINSLLRLIRIGYKEERGQEQDKRIEEYLIQAQELAGSGIRELRCSINNLRQSASYGLISQGVYQLTGSVKEFEVEVEIQGEDRQEYSHLSPVVYDCLREAITNCHKYAHATHMDVILKFGADSLSLYMFDNGKGCLHIEEGNGIRGIRQRTEQAGGTVRFISESGEGFQIYICLPYGN